MMAYDDEPPSSSWCFFFVFGTSFCCFEEGRSTSSLVCSETICLLLAK